MRIGLTGWSSWTAAGDTRDLARVLAEQRWCFGSPPYPSEGLSNPRCGRIAELARQVPAEVLLERVVREAMEEAGVDPARTGLVVGTSSGNICGPFERWHRAVLAGEEASDADIDRDATCRAVVARLGLGGPAVTVSVACVSGTAVAAIARDWLRSGRVRAVVCAGVDALSLYVHAGFSGLGALARDLPHPFTAARDGLLLGEGAAAFVLQRDPEAARVWLAGVGLATDGVHMTAPDREAGGAGRALDAALGEGGLSVEDVDLVSVHGTGTRYNDAMEATLLTRRFGPASVGIHGVKHLIGHTMGAAGAIEAVVLADAMASDGPVPPPPEAHAAPDDDDPTSGLLALQAASPGRALGVSLSSAFGGMNACLALSRAPVDLPETDRPTRLLAEAAAEIPAGTFDWRAAWPDAPRRTLRLDRYTRVVLLALRDLQAVHAISPDAALVLASRTSCRLRDLRHHARLVTEGAAHASRLDFTYTIPVAPLAEACLCFGWHGPILAFVGDPSHGEAEARARVSAGHGQAVSVVVEAPTDGGRARAAARLWEPA